LALLRRQKAGVFTQRAEILQPLVPSTEFPVW
jgi:hypothetical protein